jgi:hypothetical protein
MRIWELTPTQLSSPNWNASLWQEKVIARAETEADARMLANLEFAVAVQVLPGESTVVMPWNLENHVIVRDISKNSNFSTDGDEEILYPNVDEVI